MLADSTSTWSNLCAALPAAFLQSWQRFPRWEVLPQILRQHAVLHLLMHLHRHLDGCNNRRRFIHRMAASCWQESDYYPCHFIPAPPTVRFYCKRTPNTIHPGTFRAVLLHWILGRRFHTIYRLHQWAPFTRCQALHDVAASYNIHLARTKNDALNHDRGLGTSFLWSDETLPPSPVYREKSSEDKGLEGSLLTEIAILLSL